jgi:hypothetical protein
LKGIALAIVCLLVSMVAATVATNPNAQGRVLINTQLTEQSGSTGALGGGDYLFVRFGSDAAFGVVYGNATNHNGVYVVAIKARYLGVGQVYDQQGKQVASNRPIKIYTIYAIKLDDIVEFRDRNTVGIADYTRSYNGTDFTGYQLTDTFYKKVSLRASWTRGSIQENNGTEWRSWTFNLSAINLPYVVPTNFSGTASGSLPLARFTFHLNASLEQVTNATVPQWNITVGSLGGRYYVTNAARMQNLTVNGKVVHYGLKWDHLVQGWSYDAKNSNPRLLMEFHSLVGNFIPAVVDTWIEGRLVNRTGEAGVVRYQTASGTPIANGTTGGYPAARALTGPYLDFGGNWTRIGRLAWVTNSTVDGVTQPLYAQIMGGWRVIARGEAGNTFVGFVLLGGLSFKGGNTIIHDPDVAADVQADLELPGAALLGLGSLLLIAGIAMGVVVGVLLLLLVVLARRRRGSPPPMPPPR